MAYSEVQDLLLGNIPLPANDKPKRAVENASDEIDGILGVRYRVPINPTGPQQRQVRSLLKTINNWLASGRLIEELTASSQTVEIHAYANNLIREALNTLAAIVRGDILLPGVPPPSGTDETANTQTGPFILNHDDASQTNTYYDCIDNPLKKVQSRSDLWPYRYLDPFVPGGG